MSELPFESDQKAQGLRCACQGVDEWYACQNVPDQDTIRAHRKQRAPAPEAAPIPADVRLWWFLFVLNACGDHGPYANDDPGEWVAAFCDDVEPTDTFNRACDLKLATCTHNSMDETSRVWITEAGKRFLADRAPQEERIREDERDRLTSLAFDQSISTHPYRNKHWAEGAKCWLRENGAMFPVQRARQRGDAS